MSNAVNLLPYNDEFCTSLKNSAACFIFLSLESKNILCYISAWFIVTKPFDFDFATCNIPVI